MRRSIIVCSLLALACCLTAASGRKWEARMDLTALFPGDSGYRDTYGKVIFMPGLELGYNFSKALGAWVGFSMVDRKGHGPLSGIPADSSQQFFSLGLFCKLDLASRATLRLAAAPMLAFYKELAGPWKVSGHTLGFDLHAALGWALSNTLGIEWRLGYKVASDDSDSAETFKLGGFGTGAGVILRF